MAKFISNKKPAVKIGGAGTYTPTIKRLVNRNSLALLARFKSNGDIFQSEKKMKRRIR